MILTEGKLLMHPQYKKNNDFKHNKINCIAKKKEGRMSLRYIYRGIIWTEGHSSPRNKTEILQ